ncbi:MAG: hypothetical protein H0X16_09575 [Chloroflexi bacterium]|nr:hypothetical protein [Chloroflexota bacterium]
MSFSDAQLRDMLEQRAKRARSPDFDGVIASATAARRGRPWTGPRFRPAAPSGARVSLLATSAALAMGLLLVVALGISLPSSRPPGDSSVASGVPSTSPTASASASAAADLGFGRLAVELKYTRDPQDAIYLHGAYSFVEIRDRAGRIVAEAGPVGYSGAERLIEQTLPSGDYQIVSYVRPCDESCEDLAEPRDHCSADVELAAGEAVQAVIRLRPTRPCLVRIPSREKIALLPSPSSSSAPVDTPLVAGTPAEVSGGGLIVRMEPRRSADGIRPALPESLDVVVLSSTAGEAGGTWYRIEYVHGSSEPIFGWVEVPSPKGARLVPREVFCETEPTTVPMVATVPPLDQPSCFGGTEITLDSVQVHRRVVEKRFRGTPRWLAETSDLWLYGTGGQGGETLALNAHVRPDSGVTLEPGGTYAITGRFGHFDSKNCRRQPVALRSGQQTPAESVLWCSQQFVVTAARPISRRTDVAIDGDFILTLTAGRTRYGANEPIEISATLEYTGSRNRVEIWGSGSGVVHFSLDEVEGNRDMRGAYRTSCQAYELRRNVPVSVPFSKSGGFSAGDPQANFWRQYLEDPALRLPAGRWDIRAAAEFDVGNDCSARPGPELTTTVRVIVEE